MRLHAFLFSILFFTCGLCFLYNTSFPACFVLIHFPAWRSPRPIQWSGTFYLRSDIITFWNMTYGFFSDCCKVAINHRIISWRVIPLPFVVDEVFAGCIRCIVLFCRDWLPASIRASFVVTLVSQETKWFKPWSGLWFSTYSDVNSTECEVVSVVDVV